MKNKYIALSLATLGLLSVGIPAFAEDNRPQNINRADWTKKAGETGRMMNNNDTTRPVVNGKVTAINGNTITILGKSRLIATLPTVNGVKPPERQVDTTYIINASNAVVFKNNATSTISSILVGDMIGVQGTVSGTNVTATVIHNGALMMGRNENLDKKMPLLKIEGTGEPVVAGTIASISGNSINITNKSNVQYSVDTTNAKIFQRNATSTISTLTVGDQVVVQGVVNGNSITASSVIDQKKPNNDEQNRPANKGFFRSIGGFFSHLFGF